MQTAIPGCPGCLLHQGFLFDYMSLRQQMLDALAASGHSGTVSLAGHSLGAAVAAIAAWDLVRDTSGAVAVGVVYRVLRMMSMPCTVSWV